MRFERKEQAENTRQIGQSIWYYTYLRTTTIEQHSDTEQYIGIEFLLYGYLYAAKEHTEKYIIQAIWLPM